MYALGWDTNTYGGDVGGGWEKVVSLSMSISCSLANAWLRKGGEMTYGKMNAIKVFKDTLRLVSSD